MRKRRLLWQLFPAYLAIVIVSLAAIVWYATDAMRSFYHEQMANSLHARSALIANQFIDRLRQSQYAAVDSLCKELGKRSSTRITVILPSGKVVGDTEENPAVMDNHADRPEIKAALVGGSGRSVRYSHTLGIDMMYVAVPLRHRGRLLGVLRCSVGLASIGQAMYATYWRIILSALIVALLVAIGSLLISRWISRHLEVMKRGVQAYADGDLSRRLDIPDSAELAGLAEAFNQMARQLDSRIGTITRQRNEREAILASMAEGLLAVDSDEKIISINRATAQMFDITVEESEGRLVQEIFRNTALQDFVTHTLASSIPVEEEIILPKRANRVLKVTGTALQDTDGVRLGAVMVFNDVTEMRRLETLRKDFVANVSHELKTPITSIKGFVETLLDGAIDQPEDARRFLQTVARHVDRLNLIIEDLLFLSRLEQDPTAEHVRLQPGELAEVVSGAVEACRPKAAEKNINLAVECPPGLQAMINAPLLEQAMINLVDNAIKYSGPGNRVELTVRQGDGGPEIAVRDWGAGISPKHLPRLFERFYRVDQARSRALGGTGLGLAIVKHIAGVHGGRVEVVSAPGEGSTFTLSLTRANSSPQTNLS